jgi:hypothetical protein
MEKEFKRYFPKVLKGFETTTGKMCLLLDKTSDVLNLGVIVREYFKHGHKFPEKQAAWIMNRLFNLACYMNYSGLVFNGFSIDNIWVSPEMHSVVLLNGWEYTTSLGEKMIGCPKDVFKILPLTVKDSKISTSVVDVESIKNIGRTLFVGCDVPVIKKYLDEASSDDVFEEWDKYKVALDATYGKREFIVWEDVPYSK